MNASLADDLGAGTRGVLFVLRSWSACPVSRGACGRSKGCLMHVAIVCGEFLVAVDAEVDEPTDVAARPVEGRGRRMRRSVLLDTRSSGSSRESRGVCAELADAALELAETSPALSSIFVAAQA
jgi:hypothetical protein